MAPTRPSPPTTTIRAVSGPASRSSSWSPRPSRSDPADPAAARGPRPRSAPGSAPTSAACSTSTHATPASRSRSAWRRASGPSSGRRSAGPSSAPSSSTATMSSRRSSSRRSSRRSSPTRSSGRSWASARSSAHRHSSGSANPAQLAWYALIGLACGAVGLLYVNNFYGLMDRFGRWSIPRVLKPAIGGFLVGCIALVIPGVLGTGYGFVQAGLDRQALLAIPLWMVLILPFAKILATSLSIGSGGSGGIFGPGMVIGGMLGAGIWRLLEPVAPAIPFQPAPFVMVGDDGPVRERCARTAGGDAHGRRDDRQSLDARAGDGRGRPGDIRGRLADDLPQPAGDTCRFAGPEVPFRASTARSRAGRRRRATGTPGHPHGRVVAAARVTRRGCTASQERRSWTRTGRSSG